MFIFVYVGVGEEQVAQIKSPNTFKQLPNDFLPGFSCLCLYFALILGLSAGLHESTLSFGGGSLV